MIVKFPEMLQRAQHAELQFGKVPFAVYKTEKDNQKRPIFLTEHMLIFVIQGHKKLHFPNKVITVDADNIILLKRGVHVLSEYIAEEQPYECLVIFVQDDFIKRFLHNANERRITPEASVDDYVIIPSNELLNSYKLQYKYYFNQLIPNLKEILDVKLQELFLLLTASTSKKEVFAFLNFAISDHHLALDYVLKQYLLQPLSIEQLARISGRSLATFKRDFQGKFQCTPRQWINRERLAYASILLDNTGNSVAEIAYACGFDHVSHFIKLFKRHYGFTPNAARTESVII